MPYTFPPIPANPSQALPNHLEHKPFYAVPYEPFDGIYAGNTDAQYLSVGTAQYDSSDISVKAMRYVNGQWSRQAEEVPVHRAVDMTILVAKALFDVDKGVVTLPSGTLCNQSCSISITRELRTPPEINAFDTFVTNHGTLVRERLNALADILNDLQRRGRI